MQRINQSEAFLRYQGDAKEGVGDRRLLLLSAALGAMGFVVLSALFSIWLMGTLSSGGRMAGLPLLIAATWVPLTLSLGAVAGFGLVRYGSTLFQYSGAAIVGATAVVLGTVGAQIIGDAWFTTQIGLPWSFSIRRVLWRSDAVLFVGAVTMPAMLCGALGAVAGAGCARRKSALATGLALGVVTAPVTLTRMLRVVGEFGLPLLWCISLLVAGLVLVLALRRAPQRSSEQT